MNILPHKSWHVYNKENQAKVAEDEAKYEEELEEKKQAQINNDRLYRLQLLRNKVHGNSELLEEYQNGKVTTDDIKKNSIQQSSSQNHEHINLFEDKKAVEVKHIAKIDKQREYAKLDKTNLFNKKNLPQPWYTRTSKDLSNNTVNIKSKHLPIVSSSTLDDPLTMIKKYTNSGQHVDEGTEARPKKKRKHKSSKYEKEYKSDKNHKSPNYERDHIREKSSKSSDRDKEPKSERSHRRSSDTAEHRNERSHRSSKHYKTHSSYETRKYFKY